MNEELSIIMGRMNENHLRRRIEGKEKTELQDPQRREMVKKDVDELPLEDWLLPSLCVVQ